MTNPPDGWSDIIDLKKAVTHKSSSMGTGAVTEADPGARIEGEKTDYRMGIVDDAFSDAARNAKRNPHGNSFQFDTGAGDTQFFSTPEHLKEKGFHAADRPSVIPQGITPDQDSPRGFVWVLTPTDEDAVARGFYCENCLQLQSDPNTYAALGQCRWAVGHKTQNTGCGWNAMHKHFVEAS